MNWTNEQIRQSWQLFSLGLPDDFRNRVEERLVAGAELYQNKLLDSQDAESFKRNFDEEMLDAAAYLWMLSTVDGRTKGLQCLLDDIEYVMRIARDNRPNLGYGCEGGE